MPRRGPLVAATLAFVVVATLIPPPAAAQRPTPVETAPVETREMTDTLTVAGRLEAHRQVVIAPEVDGQVAEIRFAEGERVEAGAVLVVLDAALEEARLAQADADLAADRRALERARTLADRGAGTEAAVDEAQAAFDRTRAEVQVRQTLLQKTRITAPFAGRTGFRQIDPGTYVAPGDPLVTLVDADPIEVAFDLPGRVAGVVAVGDAATVRPESFVPDAAGLTATVTAIDPAVDPDALALGVRAELANPDGTLRPGMFVRVDVVLDRVADARVVPEQAILPGPAGDAVYRVVDGAAVRTEVVTGLRAPGLVQITDGLAPGDTVVVAGQQKLRDGAPVRPAGEGGNGSGGNGSGGGGTAAAGGGS